jgi:DNA-directed RNA polymerase specialized sigma24 family protein
MVRESAVTDNETVSQWLGQLKRGNDQAVQALWDRYQLRQMGLARKLLAGAPRGAADEEDVALSAFNSFCIRAAEGKFPVLEDRDDLWRILATITVRKASRLARRERRRQGADAGGAMDDFSDHGISPELAVISKQELRRLFDLLEDEQLRLVAYCKLEGETNSQIAEAIGKSVPTVERKLRAIRQLWSTEVSDDGKLEA